MTPLTPVYALLVGGMLMLFASARARQWAKATVLEALSEASQKARSEIVKWAGISAVGIVGTLTAGEVALNIVQTWGPTSVGLTQTMDIRDTGLPFGEITPEMNARSGGGVAVGYGTGTGGGLVPANGGGNGGGEISGSGVMFVFDQTGDSLGVVGEPFSGTSHDSTQIQVNEEADEDFTTTPLWDQKLGPVTTDTVIGADSAVAYAGRIRYMDSGTWQGWQTLGVSTAGFGPHGGEHEPDHYLGHVGRSFWSMATSGNFGNEAVPWGSGGSENWDTLEHTQTLVALETGAPMGSAPFSPGGGAKWIYNQGSTDPGSTYGGGAMIVQSKDFANAGSGSQAGIQPDEIYNRIAFRLSTDWQINGSNKFTWMKQTNPFANGPLLLLDDRGGGGFLIKWNPQGSNEPEPNQKTPTTDFEIKVDTWYELETQVKLNTASDKKNGEVDIWIKEMPNGTPVHMFDLDTMQIRPSGDTGGTAYFAQFRFEPLWGGQNGTRNNDFFMYVDHTWISLIESTPITSISFDFASGVRHSNGTDLWPTTWHDDGKLYTAGGDGNGFDGVDTRGTDVSEITGDPDDTIVEDTNATELFSVDSILPRDIISIDGTLYLHAQEREGGFDRSVIGKSTDNGVTWTWKGGASTPPTINSGDGDFHFTTPAFANNGTFIQIGQSDPALDTMVYMLGQENTDGSVTGLRDQLVLARVHKDSIQSRSAYTFFSGTDSLPAWDANVANRTVIHSDTDAMHWGATISYNPVLHRYLMMYFADTNATLRVYEAPRPYGPWTKVGTDISSLGGDTNEKYSIFPVNKTVGTTPWISSDGLTWWATISGVSVWDSWNTVKITLN